MRLTDWVFAFVQGFRYESSKLTPEETGYFEPYVKEQMLTTPCQAEVIRFCKPYRLALLFFFDGTKQDLLISIRREEWNNLDATVTRLQSKYSTLQLKSIDLHRLLERCRGYTNGSIYAIDCVTHVCCICFTHDPRIKASPLPWSLYYVSNPQEMAEMIFNLNLGQASMYST